jgi:hypothetical protein
LLQKVGIKSARESFDFFFASDTSVIIAAPIILEGSVLALAADTTDLFFAFLLLLPLLTMLFPLFALLLLLPRLLLVLPLVSVILLFISLLLPLVSVIMLFVLLMQVLILFVGP